MIFKTTQKEITSLEKLDEELDFLFVRSSKRNKTLSLRLNRSNQWVVRAPIKCKVSEAKEFLNSKRSWIQKQTQRCEASKIQLETENIGWEEGQFQYYLGKKLKIFEMHSKQNKLHVYQNEIYISKIIPSEQRRHHWLDYLKNQAETYLTDKTYKLAQQYGFDSLSDVKLRKMKSMWGNCRQNGVITLNTRLMQIPEVLIDAVICHELCHLKYLNHSSHFYNLLESIDPQYKTHHNAFKSWSHKVLN